MSSEKSAPDGCPKCKGTGKTVYKTLGDIEPTDLGNGTTIQDMGASMTRACECVRDLPAIDGAATWWESETIYREVVQIPIFSECAEITADCEVPRDEHGRRIKRTADNAYYPPMIKLEIPSNSTLLIEDAEALVEALSAAIKACYGADALAASTAREDGYQGVGRA